MKHIFLLILILIASCKTVHKTIDESKSIIDSTKVSIKDTTTLVKQNTSTEITNAKDITIKINYGDSSVNISDGTLVKNSSNPSVTKVKTGSNKISDIVNGAISASGNTGKIPSSIEIHIGSIGDSITAHSKIDSTNVKSNDSTKLQAKKEDYKKNIDKKGMSFGSYVIIAVILLGIIYLFLSMKFKI